MAVAMTSLSESERLTIKVTDVMGNNSETFFKLKRTTVLSLLMKTFCEHQRVPLVSVRFLFDGERVNPAESPKPLSISHLREPSLLRKFLYTNLAADFLFT